VRVRSNYIRKPAKPVDRSYKPPGGIPYKVTDKDSWVTLAQRNGLDPWALIRFNYPNLPANNSEAALEVNWYLQEYVKCTKVTADGKNYMFSSSAGVVFLPGPVPPPPPPKPPAPVVNYWRSQKTIPYMFKEMHDNARSPAVKRIAKYISGEAARELSMPGEPGDSAALGGTVLAHYALALMEWKDLVKTNAVWDHKPKLKAMLNLGPDFHFPIEGDPDHEYYYDIWSNIHYGYVGRAAGIAGSTLQWGAARGGAAGKNDPMDVATIDLGILLWERYGLHLTQKAMHNEILLHMAHWQKIQASPEYQKAVGATFRHIEPITNGE
jgi:hypothetical protein